MPTFSTRVASTRAVREASLDELVERGLLAPAPDHVPAEGAGGRERFYALTDAGREALEAEAGRMEGLAHVARLRLTGTSRA